MLVQIRRLTQIFFFLFFIYLFLTARYPYQPPPDSDFLLRFSPLIPLFDFIKHLRISFIFWPALLILVVTPFMGRVFCGWMCPLGTLLDMTDRFLKPPDNRQSAKWHKWRYLKFALLVLLILCAVFSVNLWGFFDPLSIFNRALTIIFYPLFTLIAENGLLYGQNIPVLGQVLGFLYDLFKSTIMPENQAHYQQLFWILIFIAGILSLEKLSRRFWCRYLCPAGALLGFLSQFRFLERVVKKNSCPVCLQCQHDCKMNAIPADDPFTNSKVECIQCFSCAQQCPEKHESIRYLWRWRSYRSTVDFSRRQFLQTTGASAVAIAALRLGLPNRAQADRLIRPPGAAPEDEFLDLCIRCQECVRICASNGACLQPSAIHTSLLEWWTPQAVMREGYCEYNCNLCTQVCPTDAIKPLTLTEKQKTVIGLAVFDKNTCIPYSRNEECLVCEEHCPLPDKAIKFETKSVKLPDGTVKSVRFPYVVKELCIGCGICEYKCPLPGDAGIFIKIPQAEDTTST